MEMSSLEIGGQGCLGECAPGALVGGGVGGHWRGVQPSWPEKEGDNHERGPAREGVVWHERGPSLAVVPAQVVSSLLSGMRPPVAPPTPLGCARPGGRCDWLAGALITCSLSPSCQRGTRWPVCHDGAHPASHPLWLHTGRLHQSAIPQRVDHPQGEALSSARQGNVSTAHTAVGWRVQGVARLLRWRHLRHKLRVRPCRLDAPRERGPVVKWQGARWTRCTLPVWEALQ
jgi:hypothetical protein